MSLYDFFSYCFNVYGIEYEIQQNELLHEIEKDITEN